MTCDLLDPFPSAIMTGRDVQQQNVPANTACDDYDEDGVVMDEAYGALPFPLAFRSPKPAIYLLSQPLICFRRIRVGQ